MMLLPAQADLGHLKKQAKDLLRLYRGGDPEAHARFLRAIPATPDELRLHDAQSCIAREYGFVSWTELKAYVETQSDGRTSLEQRWLSLIYSADITGVAMNGRPTLAARMLASEPGLATSSPYLACAAGDEATLRANTDRDPAWVNRPGGPLDLPPLIAVTHSSLLRLPAFRERLLACAQHLLAAGADPNSTFSNRAPPASRAAPDHSTPLSALYGAAGSNRDPAATRLLLESGADPNDNESLYHSLENPECTRLLLAHAARIEGTNAMYRALDLEDPTSLELLLAHGGNPNEPARSKPVFSFPSPLLFAIRRRRSPRHVELLLDAGADLSVKTPAGLGPYRLARQFGLTEVAALLQSRGAAEPLPDVERFIAACASGDEPTARAIVTQHPELPGTLSAEQQRLLPDIVAEGGDAPARLMVALGWPISVRGGDWSASALNLAVFRGNVSLTRFLLEHGASWTEQQGFGDNVCGTLSWASCNEPVDGGDWPGCARALLDHGMPPAIPTPENPEIVTVGGTRMRFSEDVLEILLSPATPPPAP